MRPLIIPANRPCGTLSSIWSWDSRWPLAATVTMLNEGQVAVWHVSREALQQALRTGHGGQGDLEIIHVGGSLILVLNANKVDAESITWDAHALEGWLDQIERHSPIDQQSDIGWMLSRLGV